MGETEAAPRKIEIDAAERDEARSIAAVLSEIIEPSPEAVTLFERAGSGWRIEAYFAGPPPMQSVHDTITAALGHPVAVREVAIPDENWVALSQAALPPVAAGRFTVHGSHDIGRVARGPNAILIDAGEAFGTAHHATTLGCLEAIDVLTRRQRYKRVLDLGCGSGVLAIAAARVLPHARIVASDIDERAVEVASENVRLNGVAGRIQVQRASGSATAARAGQTFDLVIANILAGPLVRLTRGLARTVSPKGTLLLSGLLIPQAPDVIAAYRAAGFQLLSHRRITGWSTVTLVRSRQKPV